MILLLLMIGLLGFIIGFLAFKQQRQRYLIGGAGLLVLIVSAGLMIGNDTQHWGMRPVTTTTTTKLQSAVNNDYVDLLLYEPIKRAHSEKVYIYQAKDSAKRQHTAAKLTTHVKVNTTTGKTACLTTKTTRWTYSKPSWRWLFMDTGSHTTLIKQQQTFSLPKNWATLSVSQAQWLAKQAKALAATKDQQVTLKVKQLLAANPQLTSAQATHQVEQQLKQAEPQLLAKLIKQAQQRSPY